jgi:two-component system, LytTR family, response regulator AlgR
MNAEVNVLIVDDEPRARERLERLLGEIDGWCFAGACGSGPEAIEHASRLRPGVVLLDIRMPGMDGIETAQHLSRLEAPPAVIFTTAYDQYAIDAFEARAVGYLLKPVRRERLESALSYASRVNAALLDGLAPPRGGPPRRHVAARVRDELRLIPVKEVLYFRAEQKYVTVRHLRGEDVIDEPLKRLEDEFADEFVRIHRSVLVSVQQIDALERHDDGYVLRLRPGETLPVSRRQLTELKRRLGIG